MGLKERLKFQYILLFCALLSIGYSVWYIGSNHLADVPSTRFLAPGSQSAVVGDLGDLVNVFIGTTKDGHVFPGATLPHGMIKAGMDTDSRGNVRPSLHTSNLHFTN